MDKQLWISSYGLSFYPNQLFVAPTQEWGGGAVKCWEFSFSREHN